MCHGMHRCNASSIAVFVRNDYERGGTVVRRGVSLKNSTQTIKQITLQNRHHKQNSVAPMRNVEGGSS